ESATRTPESSRTSFSPSSRQRSSVCAVSNQPRTCLRNGYQPAEKESAALRSPEALPGVASSTNVGPGAIAAAREDDVDPFEALNRSSPATTSSKPDRVAKYSPRSSSPRMMEPPSRTQSVIDSRFEWISNFPRSGAL